MNVNIYIETSFKGPSLRRAVGAWIVECITSDGEPNTRGGLIYADWIGENDLVLRLVEKAFSILTKTCCVVVFTSCGHVLRTMQNHWLTQWRKNGWINAKGRLIRNAEAWNRCANLFDNHMTEWTDQWHTYRLEMQRRIRIELELEHAADYEEIVVEEWNTPRRRKERENHV